MHVGYNYYEEISQLQQYMQSHMIPIAATLIG